MFEYIFRGQAHSNTGIDHMKGLGMSSDQIDSVLQQKAYEAEEWAEKRQQAYRLESDPLFIEWQHDSKPEQEQLWRDKVAEIKLRYPKHS